MEEILSAVESLVIVYKANNDFQSSMVQYPTTKSYLRRLSCLTYHDMWSVVTRSFDRAAEVSVWCNAILHFLDIACYTMLVATTCISLF